MGVTHDICYLCGAPGRYRYKNMQDHIFGAQGTWNYKSCDDCGLTWLTPHSKEINQAYADYYTHENADTLNSLSNKSIQRIKTFIAASSFGYSYLLDKKKDRLLGRALSIIGPLQNIAGRHIMWLQGDHAGRLLDIGCGDGAFMARMRQMGWEVTGIEPDLAAAENARKKFDLNHIHAGFLEDAGFADNSFDAVTMAHVIEHLPDPIKTIRECRRILRPGGKLVITTPNSKSLGERWFGKHWRGWEPPRHLFLFTVESLQTCAHKADFTKCEVRTSSTTAFDVWKASSYLRGSARTTRNISPRSSKKIASEALAFWLGEYLFNLFSPCGEELALFAVKD